MTQDSSSFEIDMYVFSFDFCTSDERYMLRDAIREAWEWGNKDRKSDVDTSTKGKKIRLR